MDEVTFRKVEEVMRKKNNSSPGPDRNPYRLIKLIQGTELGQCLFHDIGRTIQGLDPAQPELRDLQMVMITKPGRKING